MSHIFSSLERAGHQLQVDVISLQKAEVKFQVRTPKLQSSHPSIIIQAKNVFCRCVRISLDKIPHTRTHQVAYVGYLYSYVSRADEQKKQILPNPARQTQTDAPIHPSFQTQNPWHQVFLSVGTTVDPIEIAHIFSSQPKILNLRQRKRLLIPVVHCNNIPGVSRCAFLI
jgi:hypothetical protein